MLSSISNVEGIQDDIISGFNNPPGTPGGNDSKLLKPVVVKVSKVILVQAVDIF